MSIQKIAGVGAALALSITVAGALPATAKSGGAVQSGTCSGATLTKAKAANSNGMIDVEGEVDSNRAGQAWRWRLVHNGTLVEQGTTSTRGLSGSFTIERLLNDAAGTDTFVFRAMRPATGQVCRAVVRL